MGQFIEEGGWGMFPTMIFGFLLVASAVFTLLRPDRRWWLVVALGVATFGAGLLGTTMGLINTAKYLVSMPAEGEMMKIAFKGAAESLNNLVLALVIVIPTALVSAAGAVRAMRAGAAGKA